MPSSMSAVAAFAAGPLRRVAAQLSVSVTAGICVAFVTHTYIIGSVRGPSGATEAPYAAAVTPRDDLLPKTVSTVPAGAIDATETASIQRTESVAAETHVAKLPAVAPKADRQAPAQLDGPHPYTPPMVRDDARPAPPIADFAPPASADTPPPAIAGVDDALRPPADIGSPGQPLVLSGAAENFAADDFDAGTPPAEVQRRVPLLALPFTAVEERVFQLGDVVASIGKPKRRY